MAEVRDGDRGIVGVEGATEPGGLYEAREEAGEGKRCASERSRVVCVRELLLIGDSRVRTQQLGQLEVFVNDLTDVWRIGSCYVFFFSSRRRHTRSLCDWSSDVCSSDLPITSVFE